LEHKNKHPQMTTLPLLSTQNLSKVYATDGKPNTVITDLDLQIQAGEFTVIMGSSGSGKSTLLYLLSGLDEVSGGEIWLEERALHQLTEKQLALLRREEIGFVFQEPGLVPNLSVWENILIAGYLGREARQTVRQKARSLLEKVEMAELSQRLPSQLSGGQQQRVAIVRALINSPRILMADEPTGNLNSAASQAVLALFTDFHQQGQTILMVTHEVKSACRGDRILYFRDGQVVDELVFSQQEPDLVSREVKLTHWLTQQGW
jgi:putative ABC transport system ATP-binding protein